MPPPCAAQPRAPSPALLSWKRCRGLRVACAQRASAMRVMPQRWGATRGGGEGRCACFARAPSTRSMPITSASVGGRGVGEAPSFGSVERSKRQGTATHGASAGGAKISSSVPSHGTGPCALRSAAASASYAKLQPLPARSVPALPSATAAEGELVKEAGRGKVRLSPA